MNALEPNADFRCLFSDLAQFAPDPKNKMNIAAKEHPVRIVKNLRQGEITFKFSVLKL